MKRALWSLLFAATMAGAEPTTVRAEIYMGIRPFATLGEIKKLFPGAKITDLKPAWAQEEERLLSAEGAGLSGKIILKFHDSRPLDRRMAASESDLALKEYFLKGANETDEEALVIEWVRWVPDYPGIPITRLVSKFGPTFKKGYSDTDFQPYREWASGVSAYLDDTEKMTLRVDFDFTPAERCAEAKKREFSAIRIKIYCPATK